MNKFEIKSNIISAINKLQSPSLNEIKVKEIMETLYVEKDNEFVISFLINELFASNENLRMDVVLFLINELISNDKLESYVFELLQSNLNDEKKIQIDKPAALPW